MARGGRRAGNRGTAYTNRTDLQSALPLNAPTHLPYGDRQKLIQAQQAVPMAPAPVPGPSVAGPSPTGGPGPLPTPGNRGPLLRPTERPNEPVTAGLPTGPGPGPEALGPLSRPTGGSTVAGLLQTLASAPNATPEVRALAGYAQMGK